MSAKLGERNQQAYRTMSNFKSSRFSQVHNDSIKEVDEGTLASNKPKHAMSRAELVANMTPLNYPGKLSTGRFHYGLDAEEREIVARNRAKMNK